MCIHVYTHNRHINAFQNLNIKQETDTNPFTDFYQTDNMAKAAPIAKETELNLPKIFTGKQTDLQRFLQDTFVFLTINKDNYNNDDKKIAFVMSLINDGDAACWKQEFIGRVITNTWTSLMRTRQTDIQNLDPGIIRLR